MKILIASKNKGKINEFKALFKKTQFEVITLEDMACEQFEAIDEIGSSYFANCLIKAQAYYDYFKMPVLADDSGLEVEVLDKAPGINSARFAQNALYDQSPLNYLIEILKTDYQNVEKYDAAFVCQLILYNGDEITSSTGRIDGEIILEPRGKLGFGYDPIFYITKEKKTMAELSLKRKNQISHRANAVKNLLNKIEGEKDE